MWIDTKQHQLLIIIKKTRIKILCIRIYSIKYNFIFMNGERSGMKGCDQELPVSKFGKKSNAKDGCQTYHNECVNKIKIQYRQAKKNK